MNNEDELLTGRQVSQALLNLERKGFIKKKRDALGNVETSPGKDGKPQVVWVATNVIPLRWENN
jgi:hypothetical protein